MNISPDHQRRSQVDTGWKRKSECAKKKPAKPELLKLLALRLKPLEHRSRKLQWIPNGMSIWNTLESTCKLRAERERLKKLLLSKIHIPECVVRTLSLGQVLRTPSDMLHHNTVTTSRHADLLPTRSRDDLQTLHLLEEIGQDRGDRHRILESHLLLSRHRLHHENLLFKVTAQRHPI